MRLRLLAIGFLGFVTACATACVSGSPNDGLRNGVGGDAMGSAGTGGASGASGGGGAAGAGGATAARPADSTGVVDVTTCSGADASYPGSTQLPANPKLPDPFMMMDGTRITQQAQWACRRSEIGGQAEVYELGPKPAKPAMVTGAVSGGSIMVTVSDGTKTMAFPATITLPTTGTAPYPAMIGIGGISIGPDILTSMGVALITFPNDMIAAQDSGSSRGMGMFYDFYGRGNTAGAMIAWAWGVSRLIDALEQTPDAQIDTARLGVTGCSRNGKGALVVGAFDERIALTIPQESGSGGSASWRVSDAMLASGTTVQTLSEITGENVWFRDAFRLFNNTATRLPFDHHMLEGMVAPRALLIIENTSQVWLGNISTYTNSMAAHLIWQALGIPDKMGVSQIGDHSHCMWNGSQQPEVTAYVQKFLIGGGTADTNVLKTDGNFTFDKATWIDWDVPALQ
jgi:hypothetical protein